MGWTNPPPTGKQKAGGMTNNVRVQCSKCKVTQYIKPASSFTCGSCGHRNGAR